MYLLQLTCIWLDVLNQGCTNLRHQFSEATKFCTVAPSVWSLTLREERKLRVFENMVLRRIFGPRRDEVTEWRRFHN